MKTSAGLARRIIGRLWRPAPWWLLLVPFTALAIASVGVTIFAYTPRSPEPPMGTTECSRCHDRPSSAGAIYVAVNRTEVHQDQVLPMAPGDFFEIDFHFAGMLGSPQRFQGVGFQLVIPAQPAWRIAPGSPSYPADWSPQGQDAGLWSTAWDKAASAAGSRVTRWQEAADQKGAFHLTPGEQPLKPEWAPVVFDDRGGTDGDPDGVADHSGADALITIPVDTRPGEYPIVVSGVGHDTRNGRAMVSLRFRVRVEPRAVAAPTPRPRDPSQTFARSCGSCHALKREFLSAVADRSQDALAELVVTGLGPRPHQSPPKQGGVSPEEVAGVVQLLRQQAGLTLRSSSNGGPNIPHTVRNRMACLFCHDAGGLRPMPKGHGYDSDSACGSCHAAPTGGAPPIPHSYRVGDRCLSCHARGNAAGGKPMTAAHGERADSSCLSCHFDKRTEALMPSPTVRPAPTPNPSRRPPVIAHTLDNRTVCHVCHDIAYGVRQMPSNHLGRPDDTCLMCHQPPPDTPQTRAGAPESSRTPQPNR